MRKLFGNYEVLAHITHDCFYLCSWLRKELPVSTLWSWFCSPPVPHLSFQCPLPSPHPQPGVGTCVPAESAGACPMAPSLPSPQETQLYSQQTGAGAGCLGGWGPRRCQGGVEGSYGSFIPIFLGTFILFSILVVLIYIPTHSARGFPFLHILSWIYCL